MVVQLTPRVTTGTARYPNEIRTYRLRVGMTQRCLGGLVGHHRSTVSAWERGAHLPSLPNAFRLARVLDTLSESLYRDLYDASRGKPGTPR